MQREIGQSLHIHGLNKNKSDLNINPCTFEINVFKLSIWQSNLKCEECGISVFLLGGVLPPRAHVCVRGPSSDNGGHEWRRIGVVILDLSKLIPTFLVGKLQFHLQMDTALLLFFLSIFIQTFSRQGLVFTRGMIRVVKLHFGGINWIDHISNERE